MNLYEVDAALEACVDPETGEIIDSSAFEQLQMEREVLLENVALWIKNLNAESLAMREEEKRLSERRHSNERKVEQLEIYLSDTLGGCGFRTPRCVVSFRASSAVDVQNLDALPEPFRKVAVTPDKKAIAAAIKRGEHVPGAELVTRQNISIK